MRLETLPCEPTRASTERTPLQRHPRLARLLSLATPAIFLLACSSRSTTSPQEAEDARAGVDASESDAVADGSGGDACAVLSASTYANECTADTDCTAVTPQYNTCSPCGPVLSLPDRCETAALPKDAAAKYSAAQNASFAAFPGKSDSTCPVGQCPTPGRPVCLHGACALSADEASDAGDAGDVDAAH